jgi:hypothetical protein
MNRGRRLPNPTAQTCLRRTAVAEAPCLAAGFFDTGRINRFTERTKWFTSFALFWITTSAPVFASLRPSVSVNPDG